MISFLKTEKLNRGMTYVELIVVLSIFAVMSTIVMFSYNEFQAKVDVKNLASDIALRIVEAQKSAVNGKLPLVPPTDWNPSYGVSFDLDTSNEQFIYFMDLNDPINGYNISEELEIIDIKNNKVSYIDTCTTDPCNPGSSTVNYPFSVTFRRPDSSAFFTEVVGGSDFIQITVESLRSSDIKAKIKIYPSGRVQVN